ncbi:MAG: cyclic pyranopterin monophosphate synthase MoaC [Chloroflexi bacterium]|nr:cyclic pyranopterin monophosphate synthase MoaC [Chloroflexota bacterium]MQG05346.1 cyclic pyranopterin monophosphate synthase MoaC [SAR202 cluster bacterium]|tara:strand:- start:2660 stop:3550 length:891 start_codon:yes stop_codon:yes gene_type:complete
MIEIYTDGSCLGNPGPGGWAAIILDTNDPDKTPSRIKGNCPDTTNNRMELLAVIEGIASTPSDRKIKVYSDSKYVVDTLNKNWKRKANLDLWEKLDQQIHNRNIEYIWIKGHANNTHNEEADNIAQQEANNIAQNPPTSTNLSHTDKTGKISMVDISNKNTTLRIAKATCDVMTSHESFLAIKNNKIEKGDVISSARIAGILAAKKTSSIIPLCHPILISHIEIAFNLDEANNVISITSKVTSSGQTGVEMEALTAVTISALTIYDMCKSIDKQTTITNIRLLKKSGGKSGIINFE